MSAILKFDFQKREKITFFWSKFSKLHKKRPNFACGNYIFPKTRENKNKPWTHSTPLNTQFKPRPYLNQDVFLHIGWGQQNTKILSLI